MSVRVEKREGWMDGLGVKVVGRGKEGRGCGGGGFRDEVA